MPGWFPALFFMSFSSVSVLPTFAVTNDSNYENRKDKWKHFGINYAICALLGDYGVPFALGASLGKEYGDEMSPL